MINNYNEDNQKLKKEVLKEMILLLKSFFGGAACGAVIAFMYTFFTNLSTFKKENKITVKDIFIWVIIGFLIGGAIGAACFG